MLQYIEVFVGFLGALGLLALGAGVLILTRRGSRRSGRSTEGDEAVELTLLKLNETWRARSDELRKVVMSEPEWKAVEKQEKEEEKQRRKQEKRLARGRQGSDRSAAPGASLGADQLTTTSGEKRVFVLTFHGDLHANQVTGLRVAISALVPLLRKEADTVVLKLESPGGVVHGYGLAAAQVLRLKQAAHKLVVCVDKVAASGGYMMACLADEIVCSPFAVVGSIGVVAGVPNLNRLLRENNVDYLEMTAGKHKRTLSVLGEVTDDKKEKFQTQLEAVHTLFKEHVVQNRPNLDLERVATGEHWHGVQALELGLVDRLGTSDDVVANALRAADVFELHYCEKESVKEKLAGKFLRVFEGQRLGQSVARVLAQVLRT